MRCWHGPPPNLYVPMSKHTKKRKIKTRKSKANHGRKPNCGR
jgi:hypothetical protein